MAVDVDLDLLALDSECKCIFSMKFLKGIFTFNHKIFWLDQQQFIALLDGGPLGSAYALQKLDEMRRHQYPAGFPVRLALKDLELVREVEQSSRATMPLLDAVLEHFMTASQDHADEDLAAIYELGGPGKA